LAFEHRFQWTPASDGLHTPDRLYWLLLPTIFCCQLDRAEATIKWNGKGEYLNIPENRFTLWTPLLLAVGGNAAENVTLSLSLNQN
jgi:hypothetical protein